MSPIKDQKQLDDMRKRLYDRGSNVPPASRSGFSDITPTQQVAHTWANPPTPQLATEPLAAEPVARKKRRFGYRAIILLVTLGLFFMVIAGSSLYLYFGNNQISSKNISLTTSGALTVSGGEVFPIEVTIENKNKVPIESAVLIVNFPSGTKSAEENSRDMLEERVLVNQLKPGETLKVPLKAIIFGEENQEHEIKTTLEYRLQDSSGTFYKDADPLKFKVISSPLTIRVQSVEKVAAGQEETVTLTVVSNASTPLKNILITAEYPDTFEFASAVPSPAYRENAWLIAEILPEGSAVIKIKGLITGKADQQSQLKFQAGTPQQSNQFIIGSTLANATANFVIEQPFIDVTMDVNGTEGSVVTLPIGEDAEVVITVQNTLSDTLYDMAVDVTIAGNVIVKDNVEVEKGYYDSTKNSIRYEPSGNAELVQVPPGATRSFSFMLKPGSQTATPSFTVTSNVFARRVSEASATQLLVGTAKSEVKFTSSVAIDSELNRGTSGFNETGPVPPVANQATTYTIKLTAGAGGNDVTGGVLTTALPQYVNWQNLTKGDGIMNFNPVTKEVTWNTGDIEAGKKKEMFFQVSFLPSQTQVNTTPALLTTQRFRATDRFTGAVVRDESAPLNTELTADDDFPAGNGEVSAGN